MCYLSSQDSEVASRQLQESRAELLRIFPQPHLHHCILPVLLASSCSSCSSSCCCSSCSSHLTHQRPEQEQRASHWGGGKTRRNKNISLKAGEGHQNLGHIKYGERLAPSGVGRWCCMSWHLMYALIVCCTQKNPK